MSRLILFTVLIYTFVSCNLSGVKKEETKEPSANKAIIEEYFKHFNNHQWKKMADMYIDQPEMKDPAYGTKTVKMSKSDIVKKYTELHQMIPDVHDRVLKMYFSDDCVIVEFESSGTAPDGSKFSLPICTIFEVKNGKISKDLTYYDNFEEPK